MARDLPPAASASLVNRVYNHAGAKIWMGNNGTETSSLTSRTQVYLNAINFRKGAMGIGSGEGEKLDNIHL